MGFENWTLKHSYLPANMSLPTKHPHFLTPPIEYGDQALNSLPQLRNGNQTFGISSHDECQSFKRPRLSNTIWNPSMPKLNDRSRAAIPYKTQICLNFRRGGCDFGDNCRFAHASGEIRTHASHWQEELVVKEIATFGYMKVCKWTSNGDECPYGNRCHFHHEGVKNYMGHLGLYRKSCAINIVSVGDEPRRPVGSSSRTKEEYQRPSYRKTRLCNNWQSTNDCPYGSKCCFAHGQAGISTLNIIYSTFLSV